MRLTLLFIVMLSCAAAYARPRIIMLDDQKVSGDRIELGEVALLEEWSTPELRKLDTLDLGRAPGPGQAQRINTAFVEQRVYAALGRTGGFDFEAEPIHHVIGDGTCVTAARLCDLAEALVWKETGWERDHVTLTCVRKPRDLWLPRGDYRLAARSLSADYYGSTLIKVVALKDGVEAGSQTVVYNITRRLPAVVAADTLKRGEVITADKLEMRATEITQEYFESRLLTDVDGLIGKKVRRFVARGRALSIDDINDPPAVRRGDTVSVWVRSGAVTVKTDGEAESSGRVGDRIQVETHGRTLWGEIVKDKVVFAEVD